MSTQTMVIADVCSRLTEKDRHEYQPPSGCRRESAGTGGSRVGVCPDQKIDAVIGGQGPVIMFTGAIDTGKGFLMEQAYKTLLCSDSL